MGEEVEAQGQGLDTLHQRAETTVGRIRDVNDKSQLRKFAVSRAWQREGCNCWAGCLFGVLSASKPRWPPSP